MRYFEDFHVGQVHEAGPHKVSREEILAFAQKFDPQSFHLDDEAGRRTIYGGIIASGWHTAAISHRLLVDCVLKDAAGLGSPGVDELRWLRPVRPDDSLSLKVEVIELIPSRSKRDRGAIKYRIALHNQQGEVVMTLSAISMFARRAASIE
ncbi:MaoC family dehydratase [Stigmatella aurantiaca]|uniref:MaoC domain protein n=1 Tax=Stigmatella aurantiaca (strain DW4/3-1) TaxID=378806 RepID=Q08M83_STIAD|nr:MaoC family dehydratase [Stigmatella aurantiaca]ADO71321.1 MaoC domain protein [Stigmatella aurantiaca DW4/3-1]EAU61591.1 MoaC domain protein [Stigmatella aurantiaca DW4/3-1]